MLDDMPCEIAALATRCGLTLRGLKGLWPPRSRVVEVKELYEMQRHYGDGLQEHRDLLRFVKGLQNARYGRFIVGRKGYRSRFEWDQRFFSELLNCRQTSNGDREAQGCGRSSRVVAHRFVLRPNFELALNLPRDLCPKEARRLAKFVNSIPCQYGHGIQGNDCRASPEPPSRDSALQDAGPPGANTSP